MIAPVRIENIMNDWIECKPYNGLRVFQRILEDGHLTVLVGREPFMKNGKLGWHLSMSHPSNTILSPIGSLAPSRLPTWDEIKDARYKFCPDSSYMAMILPPKAEFINLHPTTMHLYEVEGEQC